MKRFAQLYCELDSTNSTLGKIAALERYFAEAAPADAAWAVYFLSGNKPRQVVPSRKLYALAARLADLPAWLMDDCYEAVGDLAETVAHVLPAASRPSDFPLSVWIEERLLPLAAASDEARERALEQAWQELDGYGRLVWNKLITGAFRIGVSLRSVTRALAAISGVAQEIIMHRLSGGWRPEPQRYLALISPHGDQGEESRPYPLFLAHALEGDPTAALGDIAGWQLEWKYDGIRGELIRRGGKSWLWSRGDDLISGAFPELVAAGAALPDGTVLDGEIVVWQGGKIAPFSALQQRLGRKAPGKALLERSPAALIAYDLLEFGGTDMRDNALEARRARLEGLTAALPGDSPIRLSPLIQVPTWDEAMHLRAASREQGVEGLMLKRRDSAYGVGRIRGAWWKWKIEPYTIDAVLLYAQRGHGRRASLYTDYTFGVWDGAVLVPFAKAYSGLTDAEIREVDRFIREHTLEKFGPVRSVTPQIVCELAFEGIQRSSRHKCGIAVRFPRIVRLRPDKTAAEADRLETVRALAA